MEDHKKAKNRPKRVPMFKAKRLTSKQRPGYVRRWFNNETTRLADALAGGYEYVKDDTAKTSDKRAQDHSQMGSNASQPVGNNVTAYLMEIPEEWYREDQAAKETMIADSEESFDPKHRIKDNMYGSLSRR